jgi:hypothetical protein
MRRLATTLALLAPLALHAQYTCTAADGRKSFQDVPCPQEQKAEKLTLHQRNAIGNASERPAAVRRALATGGIAIGMTRAELYRVFGEPHKVNASLYASGSKDQLIYLKGQDTWYVYVDNGVVVAVQHRPGSNIAYQAAPQRQCPSEQDIRNMEVDANRQMGETPESRAASRRRLDEARACQGPRRPSMGVL